MSVLPWMRRKEVLMKNMGYFVLSLAFLATQASAGSALKDLTRSADVDLKEVGVPQAKAVALAGDLERFHYDAKSGVCVNAAGKPGLNVVAIKDIEKTGNGECADLNGVTIAKKPDYQAFKKWNLRGANLNGATLSFTHLLDPDLSGAQMESSFRISYAAVCGRIDRFTKFPSQSCEVEDGVKLACSDFNVSGRVAPICQMARDANP